MKNKAIVPDVLPQPHNASLEMTFYEGKMFPRESAGYAFAAAHGSWNQSVRTGCEAICVPIENGRAISVYEDFLARFVTPEGWV